jgi:hypothetical protein
MFEKEKRIVRLTCSKDRSPAIANLNLGILITTTKLLPISVKATTNNMKI